MVQYWPWGSQIEDKKGKTQILMAVFDIWIFSPRIHFSEGGLIKEGGDSHFSGEGSIIFRGIPLVRVICFNWEGFQKVQGVGRAPFHAPLIRENLSCGEAQLDNKRPIVLKTMSLLFSKVTVG